jgi:hypothetical protein
MRGWPVQPRPERCQPTARESDSADGEGHQLQEIAIRADGAAIAAAALRHFAASTSITAVALHIRRAVASRKLELEPMPSLAVLLASASRPPPPPQPPILSGLLVGLTRLKVHADLSTACWRRIPQLTRLRHLCVEWFQLLPAAGDAGAQEHAELATPSSAVVGQILAGMTQLTCLELGAASVTETRTISRNLEAMPELASISLRTLYRRSLLPLRLLAQLTALTYLDEQSVEGLELPADLVAVLHACPQLAALQLAPDYIGRRFERAVQLELEAFKTLSALGVHVETVGSQQVLAALRPLSALVELRLMGRDVLGSGAGAAGAVNMLLRSMTGLTQLRVQDAPCDDACAAELAPALRACTQLQHVELCATRQQHLHDASWSDGTPVMPTSLGAAGAEVLAPALAKLTRLTTLQLSGHLGVRGAGARALARHLTALRRLRPCGDKRELFGPQPHERTLGPALSEGGPGADVLSYIDVHAYGD